MHRHHMVAADRASADGVKADPALLREVPETRSSSASAGAGMAWSINPATDLDSRPAPVTTMLTPTSSATIGSNRTYPVTATRTTPTMTPTEVHTSVSRCLPSAVRARERYCRPARTSTTATAPLTTPAAADTTRPAPTSSKGRGCSKRSTAATMMATAATKIITASTDAERYSAFPWPKL